MGVGSHIRKMSNPLTKDRLMMLAWTMHGDCGMDGLSHEQIVIKYSHIENYEFTNQYLQRIVIEMQDILRGYRKHDIALRGNLLILNNLLDNDPGYDLDRPNSCNSFSEIGEQSRGHEFC